MNLIPPDDNDYTCPSTREQFRRLLAVTNTIVQAPPRPLSREDPGEVRYIRRPRKLRKPNARGLQSTPSGALKRHPTDDGNKMRWKRILNTARSTLTIQPTSVEDSVFLDGLIKDADKCLEYAEWFQRYNTAVTERFLGGNNGQGNENVDDNARHLLNNVSLRCHLEAVAPLYQEDTVPDRWHVPTSLSVLGRPMTREHLALALSFKWRGVPNPMQLRPCRGWQGECLLVVNHGRRPFELPPYRLLTDYLENNETVGNDTRWHWGQPMCLVCRVKSLHFPLLTRDGCDIKGSDFSMYHDYDFVDVRPEYVIRIPRPCRESESGVMIQTQTLVVLAFTKALRMTEDGYDVSAVCTDPTPRSN